MEAAGTRRSYSGEAEGGGLDQGVQMVRHGCRLPVREELQVCPCVG